MIKKRWLAGVIMLLRELHKQAQLEGGAVYMLNGNHESLNVSGNFRLSALSSCSMLAPVDCKLKPSIFDVVADEHILHVSCMISLLPGRYATPGGLRESTLAAGFCGNGLVNTEKHKHDVTCFSTA